jgi:hypothetical protein
MRSRFGEGYTPCPLCGSSPCPGERYVESCSIRRKARMELSELRASLEKLEARVAEIRDWL